MLKEKLQQDMKNALKSGDSDRRTLIGMVMSSIKNKEIDKKGELDDVEVIAVIATEIKKRKDSIAEFEKGGRPELAESERAEAEVLMSYLPKQLSDDELRILVEKAISSTGATTIKDMGKVMTAVKDEAKGSADGQRVSTMVKEILTK